MATSSVDDDKIDFLMKHNGSFIRWNEFFCAQLRAELDAYYARLYGLTRDDLRYISDSKEVHGEDFPAKIFRVLMRRKSACTENTGRPGWCWRLGMGKIKDEGEIMA